MTPEPFSQGQVNDKSTEPAERSDRRREKSRLGTLVKGWKGRGRIRRRIPTLGVWRAGKPRLTKRSGCRFRPTRRDSTISN